jgi:hypothetical protein
MRGRCTLQIYRPAAFLAKGRCRGSQRKKLLDEVPEHLNPLQNESKFPVSENAVSQDLSGGFDAKCLMAYAICSGEKT